MRPRVHSLAALLAIAALSAIPASAQAAKPAWEDCSAHGGTLTQHYTISELNYALAHMPTYIQEYSDCYSTIQAQLSKQLGLPIAVVHHRQHSDSGSSSSSTVLIVAIAVLALAGIGLALWAAKRRGGDGQPPSDGDLGDGPPPSQPPAGEPPPAA